ncbi:MAG: CBS domain-containing protein [Anaerolineales bacterium]
MTTVREIISSQGANVITISPQATAFEAMQKMAEHNIGALLVAEEGRILGILSERDCVRKLDIQERSSRTTRVEEIMTPRVLYIEASRSIEECMALMLEKNIRHLPVMEGDQLLGLISIRDLLKAIVDEQQILISNLERYIIGGGR